MESDFLIYVSDFCGFLRVPTRVSLEVSNKGLVLVLFVPVFRWSYKRIMDFLGCIYLNNTRQSGYFRIYVFGWIVSIAHGYIWRRGTGCDAVRLDGAGRTSGVLTVVLALRCGGPDSGVGQRLRRWWWGILQRRSSQCGSRTTKGVILRRRRCWRLLQRWQLLQSSRFHYHKSTRR